MAVRTHKELIPRTVFGLHTHSQPDLAMFEQLSKNITRNGITNPTLNYLRVSGDIFFIVFFLQISIEIIYKQLFQRFVT